MKSQANLAKNIIYDSHVHIGQFEGLYFSPEYVISELFELGVSKWVISSTSAIENNYEKLRFELMQVQKLAPEQSIIALWVTPEMIEQSESLQDFSDIHYSLYKMHGFANKWYLYPNLFERVFELARLKKIPILLHTGGSPQTDANYYLNICIKYFDVKIILAHGRPTKQAIHILKKCDNVYVDTAFMSKKNIKIFLKNNLQDRILFGTDFPINRYFFPKLNVKKWYNEQVANLINIMDSEIFSMTTKTNFQKVFLK